jgi:hypothetical protein
MYAVIILMMNNTKEAEMNTTPITHEAYIAAIRTLAIGRLTDDTLRRRLLDAKLVYGSGMHGTRGVTFFAAWQNGETQDFVEICATGEESDVQIAGTTIHELAHVLAGPTAGHGKAWKAACAVLGLEAAEAAGQSYAVEHFDAALWVSIVALPLPTDGKPVFRTGQRQPGANIAPKLRPCPLGIGTRGGKSRGVGSGSRLRLWQCGCERPVKVRVASDDFDATCNRCGSAFTRAESQPNAEAA